MAFPPIEEDLDILQEEEPQEEAIVPEEDITPDPEVLQAQQDAEDDLEAEEELCKEAIFDLITIAEEEDKDLRIPLVNIYKRNTYYFNNIQNIFFDPIARDYRNINTVLEELQKNGINGNVKIINVYRAWIESIIAALSVETPTVEFAPEDADNPDDVESAKAFENIGKLISQKNAAALLLIKALVILMNKGTIFGHNRYKYDPSYGTFESAGKTVQKEVKEVDYRCPGCGELLESAVPSGEGIAPMMFTCESCGMESPGEPTERIDVVDEVVEWDNTPKGMSLLEIYGPTEVKAPLYAHSQAEMGYIILRIDDNIAKFRAEYQESLGEDEILTDKMDLDSYERWGRLPPEYLGEFPKHMATVRHCYFRPWYYYTLEDVEKRDILLQKYPNGLRASIIGDTIVEKEHTDFDREWTVSEDPRAEFIHAEPAGNAIIPVQDAENDIFNLGLQSIEFGIPETFVHPKTVNLKKYSESQAMPGMMSPAMPYAPDRALADGFHTIKTATMSGEYSTFAQGLQSRGQLVSGALPSLFGGQSVAGSKTADEYRQSRAQALQRVQIPWRTIKVFWNKFIYKGSVQYAENLQSDEKFQEKRNGSYINIWIYKSSLLGKVGQVEPDMNETLPSSWAQKRDFITKMIEMKDDTVHAILLHPNNSEVMRKYTGLPDLYIPGANDRNKQHGKVA